MNLTKADFVATQSLRRRAGNRVAERLGGFQIGTQNEFARLLDRQIGGLFLVPCYGATNSLPV